MRTKAECAALIIETMQDMWAPLVGFAFGGVQADPKVPGSQEALKQFLAEGLSGVGEVGEGFIKSGTSIGCSANGIPELAKQGISADELKNHGFLRTLPKTGFSREPSYELSIAEIVRANGLNHVAPEPADRKNVMPSQSTDEFRP